MNLFAETQENVFALQPDASLDQAAPVVDQWYTVLDTVTSSLRVYVIYFRCNTVDTAQIRVTIDGTVYTVSVNVLAAGVNCVYWSAAGLTSEVAYRLFHYYAPLSCNSIKVEARVTTAGGGNLLAYVVYEKQW